MRAAGRLLLAAGVAAAGVPAALAGPAAAAAPAGATVRPAVIQAAWFWQRQADLLVAQGAPAPPAEEPSGVPAGDLAVAVSDPSTGAPSKETYLAFDVGKAIGGTVASFTFTIPLDPAATQLTSGTVPLQACLPTRAWQPGSAQTWKDKPDDDCTAKVAGRFDATKQAYTFAVPAYAASWVRDVNLGVAIRPVDGQATPFQLVFAPPAKVTATMTYLPAAPAPTAAGGTPSGTGGGAGSAGGSLPGGAPPAAGTGASLPPVPLPGPAPAGGAVGPAVAGPAPQVAGTAGEQPVVAPSSGGQPVAARTPLPDPGAPPALFWVAAAAGLAVLIATSLVLGDPAPRAPVAERPLDRALRAHSRAFAPDVTSPSTVPPGAPG